MSSSDSSNARREDHAYDIGVPRRGEIYELLHTRGALRRAFIMNEVLGKPIALREPNDSYHWGGGTEP